MEALIAIGVLALMGVAFKVDAAIQERIQRRHHLKARIRNLPTTTLSVDRLTEAAIAMRKRGSRR